MFRNLVEVLHLSTAGKALVTSALLIIWGETGYSVWLSLLALLCVVFFLNKTGAREQRLLNSSIVVVFGSIVLVRSLHPFAYGIPSALFMSVLISSVFFLLYGLSRSEFLKEEQARKIYYSTVFLTLFLAITLALPFHHVLSLLGSGLGVFLIAREELEKFSALALSLISFEILIIVRLLPLNFLNAALLLTLFVSLGREALLTVHEKKDTREYILRQVTIALTLILLIFILTKWSL